MIDTVYEALRRRRPQSATRRRKATPSPKLIFIIRPIAVCWATACADAEDETDRQDRSGCGRAGAEPDAQWQSSRDGIARASRSKIQERSKKRLQESYKQLLHSTGQVVAQAKRIAPEVDDGVKKAKKRIDQVRLEALKAELDRMIPVTQQVMRQTKARIFKNDLHAPNKLVSLFGNSHADYPQRE